MTSRSLSSNKSTVSTAWYFRDRLKRSSWVFIIALIGFLGIYVLQGCMALSDVEYQIKMVSQSVNGPLRFADMQNCCSYLTAILSGGIGYNESLGIVFAIAMSCVAAVAEFGYLHSKKKIDFYHSQPVSRKKHFLCRYLCGIFHVLIPLVLAHLVTLGIFVAAGYASYLQYNVILVYFAALIVSLIFTYTGMTLCMILCGNTFIALLLQLWVCFSPTVIYNSGQGYMFKYLQTYYDPYSYSNKRFSIYEMLKYFSYYDDTERISRIQCYTVVYLILAVAGIVLCYLLYRRRKSEAAGNAIAFPKIKVPLRLYMVCVAAFAVGWLIDRNGYWMLFAIIIGAMLCNMIVSVVYHMDYHKLLAQWYYIPITVVIVLAIVSVYKFDITGYDTWLPDRDSLQAVGISHFSRALDDADLRDENNIDTVYDLAQNGVLLVAGEAQEEQVRNSIVAFRLANGKVKYRNYPMTKSGYEQFCSVIMSEEYREKYWTVYQYTSEDIIAEAESQDTALIALLTNGDDYVRMTSKEDIIKIWNSLREEISYRTNKAKPVYSISLAGVSTFITSDEPKTLALAEELTGLGRFEVDLSQAEQLNVSWSKKVFDETLGEHTEYSTMSTDDTDTMQMLLDHCFFVNSMDESILISSAYDDQMTDVTDVTITMQNGNTVTLFFSYYDYPQDVFDACLEQAVQSNTWTQPYSYAYG